MAGSAAEASTTQVATQVEVSVKVIVPQRSDRWYTLHILDEGCRADDAIEDVTRLYHPEIANTSVALFEFSDPPVQPKDFLKLHVSDVVRPGDRLVLWIGSVDKFPGFPDAEQRGGPSVPQVDRDAPVRVAKVRLVERAHTAEPAKRHRSEPTVEWSVDPPQCAVCKRHVWPATKYNSGKHHCFQCDIDIPWCAWCDKLTWNGWWRGLVFVKRGDGFVCKGCWIKNEVDCGSNDRDKWIKWFSDRETKYPSIINND